jgi:hypothetical protein
LYNSKVAADGQDYLDIMNALFMKKQGDRAPEGLVSQQVHNIIDAARRKVMFQGNVIQVSHSEQFNV